MALTATEETGSNLQKGLSEWWSEETEYVFQRIERWAAFARGYNRLHSQRLSRGRMTMQEDRQPGWTISANRLVVNEPAWNPSFHSLKRCQRRKSRPEETKINCCGTFNYQSNSNLDSNCLETYRYDHSIYFKTIGEIRSSKRDLRPETEDQDERISVSSDEQVEWEAEVTSQAEEAANNNEDGEIGQQRATIWPIVDLGKLDIKMDKENDGPEDNNNFHHGNSSEEIAGDRNCNSSPGKLGNRKLRRPEKSVVHGEDNVVWPGVLLSYNKNFHPPNSPHRLPENKEIPMSFA